MVFAEDAKRLFSLHQREEVIGYGLPVEEVVHTQQEVPAGHTVAVNLDDGPLGAQQIQLRPACLKKAW